MPALASLSLPDTDTRRALAAKYARHMPADAAAAAVLLAAAVARGGRGVTDPKEHASGARALLTCRIFAPLAEPNLLATGRMILRPGAPVGTVDPDGVTRIAWASPAEHTAALTDVTRTYLAAHSLVRDIADACTGSFGLDSWHSPLALLPVRHTYADGSPGQTRWMAADGTARILGARLGLAANLTWLADHPYRIPDGPWPADAVTQRTLLAAARSHSDTDPAGHTQTVEDWADLILPVPNSPGSPDWRSNPVIDQVGLWNFRSHSGPASNAPRIGVSTLVEDYLTEVDLYSGADPQDLLGLNPDDPNDADQMADDAEEFFSFLLPHRALLDPREIAARIALCAVACHDQRTAPTSPTARDLLTDYANALIADTGSRTLAADAADLDAMLIDGCLAALLDEYGPPRLSDLYGVWGDLRNDTYDGPLADPDSPWWWLTAAVGLFTGCLTGVRGLRGPVEAVAATARRLLGSPDGQQALLASARNA